MLQVWGRATSSNVQALMWYIGELGLGNRRYDVGHIHGGNDTAEFLAMNPNGTVPVLRDNDGPPLWESGAILRYLASKYGDDPFWPKDVQPRAAVDIWAEWAKLNVAQMFTVPVFWRVVRTAADARDPVAIAAALEMLHGFLRIAEVQLAHHEFLAGEVFTLADIQFGHVLYRYFDIDIARLALPNVEAYYRRLTERPAFIEHVMVSYDVLRA